MAELSRIGWCDHTHNHWIGCAKVSSGCTYCYAERDIARSQRFYGTWGPKAQRILTSVANRELPLKWNQGHPWLECSSCGWRGSEKKMGRFRGDLFTKAQCPACQSEDLEVTRQRVFCASLADVFEGRDDLVDYRRDLFRLINKTPNLTWMLLTKRPENVNQMVADIMGDCAWLGWSGTQPRDKNIWIGTSIENQAAADQRIPHLLDVWSENVLKFLSVEPMLGQIRLAHYFRCSGCGELTDLSDRYDGTLFHHHHEYPVGHVPATVSPFDWVIAGGESGPEARAVHPFWFRNLREQCVQSDTPFFFKQWGEYRPLRMMDPPESTYGVTHVHTDGKVMVRVGREKAGDELDGRTWHQFPGDAK